MYWILCHFVDFLFSNSCHEHLLAEFFHTIYLLCVCVCVLAQREEICCESTS